MNSKSTEIYREIYFSSFLNHTIEGRFEASLHIIFFLDWNDPYRDFFQIVLTQTKGPVLSTKLNFKSMFLNNVCTILNKLKISGPFAQRVGLKNNLPHVQRSSKIFPRGHAGCGQLPYQTLPIVVV